MYRLSVEWFQHGQLQLQEYNVHISLFRDPVFIGEFLCVSAVIFGIIVVVLKRHTDACSSEDEAPTEDT